MVQNSHLKSASIISLENRNLILVLSPLSLAENKLDYFPGNQINQKPWTFQENWHFNYLTPCLCIYHVCMVCLCPAFCELWALRFSCWESWMLCFCPGNIMESKPTVIWVTPTENSTSSKAGDRFGSQRDGDANAFFSSEQDPFAYSLRTWVIPLSNLAPKTHLHLSVQVQFPPHPHPQLRKHSVLLVWQQPSCPLPVLTALASTSQLYQQH